MSATARRFWRPPALGRLRFANLDDAPAILELVNYSMKINFRMDGLSDIVYLIENCVISICQLDINGTLIGFLAMKDHPLIPSVHPNAWEQYIWTKYKAIELNARNTLWIHLLCFNPSYSRDLVDNMLKSIFMHDPYVHHIGMIKSLISFPLLIPGQSRCEGSFRRVLSMERGVPGDQMPALSIADRVEVCPRLRVRRAVEEDNDDIVPIIERQSKRLREMYGEFYISELISRHPEAERVLLVCEHKEVAVGVMCINTQINFEALEENFELSPFAGLRHLVPDPKQKTNREIENSISKSASMTITPSAILAVYKLDSTLRFKDVKSGVTLKRNEDYFSQASEADETTESNSQVKYPSNQLDVLDLLEEEDELEFDIINIDKDLLRVPEVLSHEKIERLPEKQTMQKEESIKSKLEAEEKSEKDKTAKKAAAAPTFTSGAYKPPEPKRYVGAPNAFLLELFAMDADYDERYGFDILEAAYEMFPNRDYCILCLPSSHPSFPLLDHFTLVTPFGSRMLFSNETLYVAHVNSVRDNISVRPGEASDLKNLEDILEHTPRQLALQELFESTLTSKTLSSYILLSEKQPIGMVVLGPLTDGVAVRMQYDLDPEPRRPCTDATVVAGVMSPALEPHGRWYMRDILRQSQYTTLFWLSRLFAKGDVNRSRNLMSLATHMVPVHPRRTVPNITGNTELDKISQGLAFPFALWYLERPLTSLPRAFVNNSIVVVGASRTGLSFLESLIMGPTAPYLTFSNITLVSEHGLPTVAECLKAADTCVPRRGRYTDRYLKSIPFYFYVDVMSAVMIHIDRKQKCIHLRGGGVKYYDQLVLACGQQFQHPHYLNESLERVEEVQKGKTCERMLMDNPKYQPECVPVPPVTPDNLMLTNSLFQANLNLRKLLKIISDAKNTTHALSAINQVIVYGECMEVYTCIAGLLELGISASMITFVEPFPPGDSTMRVNCFNDETVDERIQSNVRKLGIRELRRCTLAGWSVHNNRITCIDLLLPFHAITLPCFALFYYGIKAIDIHAFKAINESGLVYDGGLVVGPQFETNDPSIFAAGTCTRYSRRLYAERLNHRHYSSENVGEALARLFLKKVDPFIMADPTTDQSETLLGCNSSALGFRLSQSSSASQVSIGIQRNWQPVMKFKSPLMIAATVPGPLYYVKLRKSGPEIPMEVQLTLPHQGHTLMTDKKSNYFRVQVNELHCIESITCLARKHFSTEILASLYGRHEALFNRLLARFKLGLIDDFYEFFTRPWMSPIYQETFDELMTAICEQDVGQVADLIKSDKELNGEDNDLPSRLRASRVYLPSGFDAKEEKTLGNFRSVLEKFVARTEKSQLVTISTAKDIPSECGQTAAVRNEANRFWRAVGGDRIVAAHVARFLNKHSVTNPHFAAPRPEYYQ